MHMPSGRWIDLNNIKPTDICLEDIAHCLAGIIRWGGCTTRWETDEDHCLFCEALLDHAVKVLNDTLPRKADPIGDLCDNSAESLNACVSLLNLTHLSPRLRLLVILHDAHEAYVGDIRRPTTVALGIEKVVVAAKLRVDNAIYAHLNLAPPDKAEREIIHYIDDWALKLEALWYMHPNVFKTGHKVPEVVASEMPPWHGVTTHIFAKVPGSAWLNRVRSLLDACNLST